MRILMIFVDGIGVGKKEPAVNPFAALPSQIFTDFFDARNPVLTHGGLALRADASLGVDGIPQSATGQTTLLTGVNAAAAIGRHLNGFPSKKLREILYQHSIFKRLTESGIKAAFINVFNPLFFEALEKKLPLRNSVTTVANMAASLHFFGIEDLVKRRAVYQEFTNQILIEKGFKVPPFTPREAGEILARSAKRYDFCLYEYFQTDSAGHAQERLRAIEEVSKLDEFLLAVLDNTDLSETSIILSSDHGNLEDLSTSQHTCNPVPVLLWGQFAGDNPHIKSVLDIVPLIKKSFGIT